MKLSHLNGLRAFEATLRRGTFSAAAEELGVTVAAIGQQLKGLEEYLGIRLFDRLPSGARPTPEARAVAEGLTAGFSQLEEVFAELRAGRDGRRLSLTMTHMFFEDWMSQRLPRFYALNGVTDVKIDTSDHLVDLAAENVDMAIRFSAEAGPGYEALDLHRSCYFPACTPDFAAAHGLHPGRTDLTGVPLFVSRDITTDPEWTGWPEWLKQLGVGQSDAPVAEHTAGRATAVTGAGLVLITLTQAFNDLVEGRLVAPFGTRAVRLSEYRYRLVWPSTRRLSRAMREFRGWLSGECDQYARTASELIGVEIR